MVPILFCIWLRIYQLSTLIMYQNYLSLVVEHKLVANARGNSRQYTLTDMLRSNLLEAITQLPLRLLYAH